MWYTKEEAEREYKGVYFGAGAYIGANTYIGEGAYIGADTYIGANTYIGEGAYIGAGAFITTVCSKYAGNIVPYKDHIDIRIGCEVHDIETWDKEGEALTRKYGELKWWEKTGKNMLEFLKAEAVNYNEQHPHL